MELKKDNIESVNGSDKFIVDKEVEKAVNKVLNDNLPKETSQNHILVVTPSSEKDYSYSFYNPHNARYYFKFDKWNFKPFNPSPPSYPQFDVVNSKEFLLRDFEGCRVLVKKTLIEITNKVDCKRVFRIEGSSESQRLQTIEANVVLEKEVIQVLKKVVSIYGGVTDFKVFGKPVIPDNKIYHEKLVDSLPQELVFRNDVVKKVYNESPVNIELSSPVLASNYIRNMSLKDYSPEIAGQIDLLNKRMGVFEERALIPLTDQIRLHLEVMNNINKSLSDIRNIAVKPDLLGFLKSSILVKDDLFKFNSDVRKLSVYEGKELFDWWFTKFNNS